VPNFTQFSSGARAAAVVAALFLMATEVHAGAITVSEGDTVVFTFDFTQLSGSPPPYPDMRIHTGLDFDSVDPGVDRCRYTLYRDGNGVDPDSSIVACGIDMFEGGDESLGWLDGVLSLALTVLAGEITLDPHAIAFSAFGPDGTAITPQVTPRIRIVTEAPTGALVLSVLVAFAIARGVPGR
jgi:hypothetical protein